MEHLLKKSLDEIKQYIVSHNVLQKQILTFSEAAVYLGISKSTLYKLTSSRSIPIYKPAGKLIYFDRLELNNWLLQNRQSTMNEISKNAFN